MFCTDHELGQANYFHCLQMFAQTSGGPNKILNQFSLIGLLSVKRFKARFISPRSARQGILTANSMSKQYEKLGSGRLAERRKGPKGPVGKTGTEKFRKVDLKQLSASTFAKFKENSLSNNYFFAE